MKPRHPKHLSVGPRGATVTEAVRLPVRLTWLKALPHGQLAALAGAVAAEMKARGMVLDGINLNPGGSSS